MMSGGSGYDEGFGFIPPSPKAISQTEQAKYESEVEGLLQDALGDFNDRDTAAIRQHLDTIEQAISNDVDGSMQMTFGGSTEKHTYVNGLSDVDMLVHLNNTSLADKSPKEVLSHFAQMLEQRLPRTDVKIGDLAVTVTFSDGHAIQLLPAIKTASGFKIAQPGGSQWSSVISPRRFAKRLTEVNQQQSGKVIPAIKLIKAMNDKLPGPNRLSGYHIESLAIEVFQDYNGRQTYRKMIRHFWDSTGKQVLNPIKDRTGQSVHVDDYLGVRNSAARQRVSGAIGKICISLDRAEQSRSTINWENLISP